MFSVDKYLVSLAFRALVCSTCSDSGDSLLKKKASRASGGSRRGAAENAGDAASVCRVRVIDPATVPDGRRDVGARAPARGRAARAGAAARARCLRRVRRRRRCPR